MIWVSSGVCAAGDTQETLLNLSQALVQLRGSDRGVAEAPGAIGDAPQLARLTRTPHREPPQKVDKAGGGDNPEGATDTRVGNSSRASGGRLGMGDSAAASEGGADEAALQAQRKRPRAALWDLFDEGILGAVIDVQVAISEVHVKLVGSLQLKQKFGGKWMELVDARVRALLERHTAGHSPIYRVQKMDGNSGCALLFADQHPPHFSPLARQAFGEQAAQGVHGRRRARIPFSEAQRANMQAEILKSVDKGSWPRSNSHRRVQDLSRFCSAVGETPDRAHRLFRSESIRSAKMRDDGEELDESSIRDVEELDSDHGSHAGGDSISVAASPTSDLSVDSLDFLSPLGSPTCTRETETTVFSEMDTLLPAMDTSDW